MAPFSGAEGLAAATGLKMETSLTDKKGLISAPRKGSATVKSFDLFFSGAAIEDLLEQSGYREDRELAPLILTLEAAASSNEHPDRLDVSENTRLFLHSTILNFVRKLAEVRTMRRYYSDIDASSDLPINGRNTCKPLTSISIL